MFPAPARGSWSGSSMRMGLRPEPRDPLGPWIRTRRSGSTAASSGPRDSVREAFDRACVWPRRPHRVDAPGLRLGTPAEGVGPGRPRARRADGPTGGRLQGMASTQRPVPGERPVQGSPACGDSRRSGGSASLGGALRWGAPCRALNFGSYAPSLTRWVLRAESYALGASPAGCPVDGCQVDGGTGEEASGWARADDPRPAARRPSGSDPRGRSSTSLSGCTRLPGSSSCAAHRAGGGGPGGKQGLPSCPRRAA